MKKLLDLVPWPEPILQMTSPSLSLVGAAPKAYGRERVGSNVAGGGGLGHWGLSQKCKTVHAYPSVVRALPDDFEAEALVGSLADGWDVQVVRLATRPWGVAATLGRHRLQRDTRLRDRGRPRHEALARGHARLNVRRPETHLRHSSRPPRSRPRFRACSHARTRGRHRAGSVRDTRSPCSPSSMAERVSSVGTRRPSVRGSTRCLPRSIKHPERLLHPFPRSVSNCPAVATSTTDSASWNSPGSVARSPNRHVKPLLLARPTSSI